MNIFNLIECLDGLLCSSDVRFYYFWFKFYLNSTLILSVPNFPKPSYFIWQDAFYLAEKSKWQKCLSIVGTCFEISYFNFISFSKRWFFYLKICLLRTADFFCYFKATICNGCSILLRNQFHIKKLFFKQKWSLNLLNKDENQSFLFFQFFFTTYFNFNDWGRRICYLSQ